MSLQIRNIIHSYRNDAVNHSILDDVSFEMAAGEQLLLRGISGSGKTTLINVVAGLLTPTHGEVVLGEQSVYALSEAERDAWRRVNVGYIFQTHHLLPLLNAWENVALPLAVSGIGRKQCKTRATALLEIVGMSEYVDVRPNQLSVGQQQRIAIARALVNNPMLILADEPTASLDVTAAATALDLLQQTCRDEQTMLIIASHDPALNDRFERVADLRYGKWAES